MNSDRTFVSTMITRRGPAPCVPDVVGDLEIEPPLAASRDLKEVVEQCAFDWRVDCLREDRPDLGLHRPSVLGSTNPQLVAHVIVEAADRHDCHSGRVAGCCH